MPWWMYLVVFGIGFSALMTVRSAKVEKEIQVDEHFIEKEGEIYMERIHAEKTRRKNVSSK